MDFGDTFWAILTGLGLSAACGFRVFIPPLIVSIAAQTGNLELTEALAWLGEWPALIALSIATVVEVILYLIPIVGDLPMDVIEAPLAFVAGTVLANPLFTDMDPFLQWGLAAIAGGGSAGTLHLATMGGRAITTGSTAAMGNIPYAIAEDGIAGILPILVNFGSAEAGATGILPILASFGVDKSDLSILAILVLVFVLFLVVVLLCVAVFAIKKVIKWIVNRRQVPA